ncbi:hypothetical protein E2C01_051493 [Portunus trituberculatus]|uniref:Uncharacterized protein n=1 Tax=Portunus trituberculatus TaxID=210409 RepID=A0A5B7GEY2_PORTR|nr:hypothetical protein [Portunus trituberculatus]
MSLTILYIVIRSPRSLVIVLQLLRASAIVELLDLEMSSSLVILQASDLQQLNFLHQESTRLKVR